MDGQKRTGSGPLRSRSLMSAHFFLLCIPHGCKRRLIWVSIASIVAHCFVRSPTRTGVSGCERISIASMAAHGFVFGKQFPWTSWDEASQSPRSRRTSSYPKLSLRRAVCLRVSIASIAAHFFLWKISITRNRKQVKSHRREIGALLPTALLTKKR